jgi:hypothetical protein
MKFVVKPTAAPKGPFHTLCYQCSEDPSACNNV